MNIFFIESTSLQQIGLDGFEREDITLGNTKMVCVMWDSISEKEGEQRIKMIGKLNQQF